MPLVSVCIPTYNTARYLSQAIESVLSQDYEDYELVICDNASTDDTPEVCARYQHSRVRYLRFEVNLNQPGSFNRCLDQARGEYITLLHADDCLLPGFMADRVKRLSDYPEAGFVFGAARIIDAVGAMVSLSAPWPEDKLFARQELLASLLCGCVVKPPTVMLRRSAVDIVGAFRTDLTWGHDWEWNLRFAERFAVLYASSALAAYRDHDDSGTAEVLSAARNGWQERLILRETLSRLARTDARLRQLRRPAFKALARRHMYFGDRFLLEGRTSVARYNLWCAALADPRMLIRPTFWALLVGSLGPAGFYADYRKVRNGIQNDAERS
jgi:glycosyltransferase involved in cell wall biosynthesis